MQGAVLLKKDCASPLKKNLEKKPLHKITNIGNNMYMKDSHPMKPILWIASSLKDMKNLPEEVKKEFGHSLREIQKGKDPGNTKPLKHLGETGVLEVVVNDRSGTFRTVYTVEFEDVIAVLNVFQKKSKTGIATPKQEIDLVLRRLKQARIEYCEYKRGK